MAATAITGDFGIITVIKKGDTTSAAKITAPKRTGAWVEVASKAASGSAFGDLKIGDLFYTFPGDENTMIAGDSYYPMTEYWCSWATQWSINVTPSIIDITALGDRFPRSIEGRPTVDASINGFLLEGDQVNFSSVDADELPSVDFRELKQEYLDVTRFQRGTVTAGKGSTQKPTTATDSDTYGIFGTSKKSVSLMFYSVAADVNVGVVSAYFAPQASWAGLQVGSGDAGSRSEFTMPVTFQHDRLNRTVKAYEFTYDL